MLHGNADERCLDRLPTPAPHISSSPITAICPACRSNQIWPVLLIDKLPGHPRQIYKSVDSALSAPITSISLQTCDNCGVAFADHSGKPQESFSDWDGNADRTETHLRQIAEMLSHKYTSAGDVVVEMACGDGRILEQICSSSQCLGIGYSGTLQSVAARAPSSNCRIELKPERFQFQKVARYADLLVCRNFLEFTSSPLSFLESLRVCMLQNPNAPLFCEMPNFDKIVENRQYWKLGYERKCFFTQDALIRLFERAGFRILATSQFSGGRYIGIEAAVATDEKRQRGTPSFDATGWTRKLARFSAHSQGHLDRLRSEVISKSKGKKTILWGAGVTEIAFLNLLEISRDCVSFVIDSDSARGYTFIPGTGQQIQAPKFIADYMPDLVISIGSQATAQCRDYVRQMGLSTQVLDLS